MTPRHLGERLRYNVLAVTRLLSRIAGVLILSISLAEAVDLPTPGTLEQTIDPETYIVGPGDVLQIGFWGDVNRSEAVRVNPDGTVVIPPIGPLKVDGLTLAEAKRLIIERLSAYYRPQILSVSLSSLRTFYVHTSGWVNEQGVVEVNGATRVSQAIALAGGLADGASTRNIELRRGDTIFKVDLARYLYLGDKTANPYLTGGDVVYVPGQVGPVWIYGEVYRPGMYEYREGESLNDLIELAGGFKPSALLDTIEVQRFDTDDPTVSLPILVPAEKSHLSRFQMQLGDRVFIRAIPDWHRDAKVEIRGEVNYPGIYVIDEGKERLSDLIARAGGFTERASLAESKLIRGLYASKTYPVEEELRALSNLQDNLTYKDKDLLRTIAREPKGALSIDFEKIFIDGNSSLDLPLYAGDVIEVPRATDFVRVAGQVNNPGLVRFESSYTYKDYIRLAGGFARNADRRGTRIITARAGQQLAARSARIYPGDIIWVPKKQERSWWEITKEIIQVVAQVATIYVVIDTITTQ